MSSANAFTFAWERIVLMSRPLSVRIMPLMKCKIHRLSCVLEEKTDYFAQGRKVVRHETPRRFVMLFIKQVDKPRDQMEPLLPIISDNVHAARESPLAELARNAALNNPTLFTNFAGEHDEDALYAGLMDPFGPWHLETDLQIPDCVQKLRFTTKHEKTNISVSHWLKVTIRVERGDDVALDSKGKRKQFDIIMWVHAIGPPHWSVLADNQQRDTGKDPRLPCESPVELAADVLVGLASIYRSLIRHVLDPRHPLVGSVYEHNAAADPSADSWTCPLIFGEYRYSWQSRSGAIYRPRLRSRCGCTAVWHLHARAQKRRRGRYPSREEYSL